jgi:hypothetical protein
MKDGRHMNANKFFATGTVVSLGLSLALAGCKQNTQTGTVPNTTAQDQGPDPALANLAPVSNTAPQGPAQQPARVLGQRSEYPAQSSGQSYPQNPPQNESLNYNTQPPTGSAQYNNPGTDNSGAYSQYDQSAIDAGQAALDEQAVYADQAPPPLPVYQQPELTDPNDEWTPGYWDYGSGGYYWVPGAWVAPPYYGALWTPAYWGFHGGRYRLYHGYWGRHIGFYGGIPYGFGYTGYGYDGGYWNGDRFYYNQTVNRVNANVVHNVYAHSVPVINAGGRVSFNGPGGWNARPRPAELAVLHEQRLPAMQTQRALVHGAETNHAQFYAANHGVPAQVVAPQRIGADRNVAQPAAVNRGGFGQQPQAQQRAVQQQQELHNQQTQSQQRGLQQQQRQEQQHNQQHGLQQQQELHNQQPQSQQRGLQQQQEQMHNRQLQAQQQRGPQDQREQQLHNQQAQQQRATQTEQQRSLQTQQQPHPTHVMPEQQPRTVPSQQQRPAQVQPHGEQQHVQPEAAPRPQPQVRPEQQARPEPQVRPQPQARPEPQARPQPQARPEPQARPAAPAPRPAPAVRPEPAQGAHPAPAAHGEESHPHR